MSSANGCTSVSRMRKQLADSSGFGLIEIVVSMFLFALLAVAFLPLLIDALRATVRNATIATATQIMSEQLDTITLVPRTCEAFESWEAEPLPVTVDSRGSEFQPQRAVTGCEPGSYPAAVTIIISVSVAPDADIRVESTTLAVVESAN